MVDGRNDTSNRPAHHLLGSGLENGVASFIILLLPNSFVVKFDMNSDLEVEDD
jgi:hypothetical protein